MIRRYTSPDSQIPHLWFADAPIITRRYTSYDSLMPQLFSDQTFLRPNISQTRHLLRQREIWQLIWNDYLRHLGKLLLFTAWGQWNSCPLIRPMTSCHFSTFGSAYRSWPRHNIGLMNACSDAMHHTQEQTLWTLWASIGQCVMTISGWAPITKVFLYFQTIGSCSSNSNAAIISCKRANSLFLV